MKKRIDAHLKQIQRLHLPVSRLRGVGPKRAGLLAHKGIHTVLDLLFFVPIRYEDRRTITPLEEAVEGAPLLVKGEVVLGGEERFYRSGKRLFKIIIRDRKEFLSLLWFQYRKPYLMRFSARGTRLLVYGTLRSHAGNRQMIHPELTLLEEKEGESPGPALGYYPVYSSIKGMSDNVLRPLIGKTLQDHLASLIDPVPEITAEGLHLPTLSDALRHVHFPPPSLSVEDLNAHRTPSHRKLVFDRFFLVMLTMAFRKKSREREAGPRMPPPPSLHEELGRFFPFQLTSHQRKAVADLVEDLRMGRPMHRLLLGDVGCGKTAVAAVAAYLAVRNGYQVSVMVPTQVLANQHFEYFSALSPRMGFKPVLLTGRLRKAERDSVYAGIREGTCNLIMGTHSLIQEGLSFARLGLVIIDEQQRFGVRARALMDSKGLNPHQLVLTATPIPRTLAISLYGDLDISIIGEYPEGHCRVVTETVPREEKRRVFDTLRQRLLMGEQAFVICPVIEGSEEGDLKNAVDMAQRLKKVLTPPFRIGLIHGRLSTEEREAVMEDFRKGEIHLLVGTTVIEVGVHVPKATVMIIEHPERFGLAQLHQLRGRIGRGRRQGICFLMMEDNLEEVAFARLKALSETHDGFEIAQKDLELRGQGEFMGMKQAGTGDLDPMDMIREPELLAKAREGAKMLLDADPLLARPDNAHLRAFVDSMLAAPLDV